MALLLVPQGLIFLTCSVLCFRWLDLQTLRNLCLGAILVELSIVSISGSCSALTNAAFSIQIIYNMSCFLHVQLPLVFVFDCLSSMFLGILSTALILCFVFLGEYFEYDLSAMSIMQLSALFSQLAILFFCSGDLLSLLALWEWISIVSFFLVKHWAMRVATLKAGLKVFAISQFGDVFFIFGIVSIISFVGSSDISIINSISYLWLFCYFSTPMVGIHISLICIWSVCFTFALLLKSAQFVFYPWLLDAMEAPVPISAQLHSSTLVIIGFYVYFRLLPTLQLWSWLNFILICCGIITSIGASILGFFQEDGKRLLACSTAGQLGYVIVGLGIGATDEAALLLAFCCCNKAYTFVWLGSVMERTNGLSDFRLLKKTQLLLIERAGLVSAVCNSTIAPGAFSWHIKSLFSRGLLLNNSLLCGLAIELIAITWALSLLYMFKLVFALFASPSRTQTSLGQTSVSWQWVCGLTKNRYRHSTMLICILALVLLSITGFGILTLLAFLPSAQAQSASLICISVQI